MTSNQRGYSVYEMVVLGNSFYAFNSICPRVCVGNRFCPLSLHVRLLENNVDWGRVGRRNTSCLPSGYISQSCNWIQWPNFLCDVHMHTVVDKITPVLLTYAFGWCSTWQSAGPWTCEIISFVFSTLSLNLHNINWQDCLWTTSVRGMSAVMLLFSMF